MKQQAYLQKDFGDHWRTIYPQIVEDTYDKFWEVNEIIESQPRKAEKDLKRIITICGNGNIDAILQLGQLYNDTGKPIEGNALIHKAHSIALDCFPEDFDFKKDELLWGHTDNRPILRTFASAGLEYMKESNYEKAIDKFKILMQIDPGDRHGVRNLIPECLLHLEKYQDCLSFDSEIEENRALEFMYAKVIALFKLNNLDKAKKAFDDAKSTHSFVAEELIKKTHEFPIDEFDRPVYGIPYGSKQEAFEYWHRTKKLWQPEIVEFISNN